MSQDRPSSPDLPQEPRGRREQMLPGPRCQHTDPSYYLDRMTGGRYCIVCKKLLPFLESHHDSKPTPIGVAIDRIRGEA